MLAHVASALQFWALAQLCSCLVRLRLCWSSNSGSDTFPQNSSHAVYNFEKIASPEFELQHNLGLIQRKSFGEDDVLKLVRLRLCWRSKSGGEALDYACSRTPRDSLPAVHNFKQLAPPEFELQHNLGLTLQKSLGRGLCLWLLALRSCWISNSGRKALNYVCFWISPGEFAGSLRMWMICAELRHNLAFDNQKQNPRQCSNGGGIEDIVFCIFTITFEPRLVFMIS